MKISGKQELATISTVASGIALFLGIYTDGPGFVRDMLSNAPAWLQNPKVQWCAGVIAVQVLVLWRIWRKPQAADPPPKTFSESFSELAAQTSPKAMRAASVYNEINQFQDHVLKTPHDQVNQDYVRSMIETVYPQRIAEGVSTELRDRYVQSLALIKKKKGQSVVAWAILVFQSAFQLVRDEIWELVRQEYAANQKPWRPVFLPDQRATIATAVAFGVLVVTTAIGMYPAVLSRSILGAMMLGCAIGYGIMTFNRQKSLLDVITHTEEDVPTSVRRSARSEWVAMNGALLGLVVMAVVYFSSGRSQNREIVPPLPSTVVAELMAFHLDRTTTASDELTVRLESGTISNEEFREGIERLEQQATRILDVSFPALISNFYGENECNKYRKEIEQARKREGSRDLVNLEVGGTFIHGLTLRESAREREEYKQHLDRLFDLENKK